jgi:hypothetical protein
MELPQMTAFLTPSKNGLLLPGEQYRFSHYRSTLFLITYRHAFNPEVDGQ